MKLKKITLTGGIGSGKSLALDILDQAGYQTLSSDQIVSDLYRTRKAKKILKRLFPDAVSGIIHLKVDRKRISQQAFSNDHLHQKLTSAITPLVLKEINRRAKKISNLVFVEVPLLFECGYQNEFDAVLVITRSLKDRIESVKVRSNLTEEEIIARIKKQTDYDSLDLTPYYVIVNDGDKNSLKEKVLAVAEKLIKE